MSDPQVSTDDYLQAIQLAKAQGHTVNVDFDNLPEGVDSKAVASAMGNGLSDAHNNALSDAADNGYNVTQDFSVTHPILDTAEKTAELLGMAGGGMAGAGAGALTSPVTGPVGPVAGSIAGAGLGYGAVKSGADALNSALGYTNPVPLSEGMKNAASDVGEGAKMQLFGEGMGAGVSGAVDAVKGVYPSLAKLFTKVPKPITQMFMDNPDLPKQYSGAPDDIHTAVKAVQDGLETLHEQASNAYAEALDKLGLSGAKTADEAAQALSSGGGKSVNAAKIGENWKSLQTAWPQLNESAKLQGLALINEDINANLKWAKAGQSVDPISSKLTPYLQTVKTGVQQALDQLPGGQVLKDADTQYHEFRQIYNSLQPNLKDTGEGIKWLTNVVSDAGTASNTPKMLLQTLDAKLGQPVSDAAQKQIASGILKNPFADSMLGKMALLMSAVHPARAVTLPMLVTAQSPAAQTKIMSSLMAVQQGLKNAGPAVTGAGMSAISKLPQAAYDALPESEARNSLND